MKDDAVAPVIAVMLILAAVVTALSVWNAVYIPSQKQSSEIEHIRSVESSFLRFSSDIGDAVSSRRENLVRDEPVQLGGGDFIFNTLRSGGFLFVMDEPEPAYTLTLFDESPSPVGHVDGTLVNISYEPVGNFWQDQGYRWQRGYINVTKSRGRESPLHYSAMDEVDREFNGTGSLGSFARSFGNVKHTANLTFYPDADPDSGTIVSYSPNEGNCSRIVLRAVNMTTSPGHPYSNGNRFGKLALESRVESVTYKGVTFIMVASDKRPFGNAVFRSWNESLSLVAGQCRRNVVYEPGYSDKDYSLYSIYQQESPVDVTLDVVKIEIGAY